MRSELKDAFKLALKQRLMPIDYTENSDTIFVRELLPGVRGCIGYLTSGTLIAVKPFVGVYFEHVDQIYEEFFKPFRVVSKTTPRYFPCPLRTLNELKEERSGQSELQIGARPIFIGRVEHDSTGLRSNTHRHPRIRLTVYRIQQHISECCGNHGRRAWWRNRHCGIHTPDHLLDSWPNE